MKKLKIAVIGAGFEGLAAAAYLARDGHEVTVFEKNVQPGGCAFTEENEGYRFEVGPQWYLMPEIFDDFFADFGLERKDFYELCRLEPNFRVFFSGSRAYDLERELDNKILFSQLEPGASVELERFLDKSGTMYERIMYQFQVLSQPNVAGRIKKMLGRGLLLPVTSFEKTIKQYFHDPRLQQIMHVFTPFFGTHPKYLPPQYAIFSYADMAGGRWYPIGGIKKMANSLAEVAMCQGAKLRYSQEVTRIEARDDRVSAVYVGKKRFACEAVFTTIDQRHFETKLLPQKLQKPVNKTTPKYTASALCILLGIETKLQNVGHHNIFFDTDWIENIRLLSKNSLSEEPIFYVDIPSQTDHSAAPTGCEAVSITVPIPQGTKLSEPQIEEIIQNIYLRLGERVQIELAKYVSVLDVKTVEFFEKTFHATKGNMCGPAPNFRRNFLTYPAKQYPRIKGLYSGSDALHSNFSGGLCLLSGKQAASNIDVDLKKLLATS